MIEDTLKILEEISLTSSRKEKEEILLLNKNNEELKKLFEYVYNPYKVYGIGKKAFSTSITAPKYKNIFELLDYLLEHNTGTDIDKLNVNSFLSSNPVWARKWYVKIILKDLRIGMTEKTINKVFGDLIPTFAVQLAEPFARFYNDVACEVKIDGCRCIAIKQNGSVRLFTRNGKQLEGFNGVADNIKRLSIDNVVFDGEIIGSDYTDTMNKLFAKDTDKKGTYMIFDILTPKEFFSGESIKVYSERKKELSDINDSIVPEDFASLKFILPIAIFKNPTLDDFLALMNKTVGDGFEGIMIKPLNSTYKTKRSYDWQKLKPFLSDEFPIIDFVEGDGKYKGTLGKVIIDVDGVKVGLGSGFSDKQRDDIWNNREDYIDKEIEVQYQEKIAKTGALRFPTVKGIRLDK